MKTIIKQSNSVFNETSLLKPIAESYFIAVHPEFCLNQFMVPSVNLSLSSRIISYVKCKFWNLSICPLFLLFSLFVYIFVPIKVFNAGIKRFVTNRINWYLKRFFDIIGTFLGLILCSFIFPLIALLIKLDSKGPVFYTQIRIGRNYRRHTRRSLNIETSRERREEERRNANLFGRPFIMYKFRTMKEDAEKKCGPVWATQNDPRITAVGEILRLTHIDELPQFINILRGEMSFVGPRPERPHFVTKLASEVPYYIERLKVHPGLTGLAQINNGYDYSIDDVRTKLNYDLQYCKNGNLYSYFKILLSTLGKIMIGKINIT